MVQKSNKKRGNFLECPKCKHKVSSETEKDEVDAELPKA
jgi:hypothetical protein